MVGEQQLTPQQQREQVVAIAERQFDEWMSVNQFGMAFTLAYNFFEKTSELIDPRIRQSAKLYVRTLLASNEPAEALDIAEQACPELVKRCATAYYDKLILSNFHGAALDVAKSYLPDYVNETQRKYIEYLFQKDRVGEIIPFALEEQMKNTDNLIRRVFTYHWKKKEYDLALNCTINYADVLGKPLQEKVLPYAVNQQLQFFEYYLLRSHLSKKDDEKDSNIQAASHYKDATLTFAHYLPDNPLLRYKCRVTGEEVEYDVQEELDTIEQRVMKYGKSEVIYFLTKNLETAVNKENYELAAQLRDRLRQEEDALRAVKCYCLPPRDGTHG